MLSHAKKPGLDLNKTGSNPEFSSGLLVILRKHSDAFCFLSMYYENDIALFYASLMEQWVKLMRDQKPKKRKPDRSLLVSFIT